MTTHLEPSSDYLAASTALDLQKLSLQPRDDVQITEIPLTAAEKVGRDVYLVTMIAEHVVEPGSWLDWTDLNKVPDGTVNRFMLVNKLWFEACAPVLWHSRELPSDLVPHVRSQPRAQLYAGMLRSAKWFLDESEPAEDMLYRLEYPGLHSLQLFVDGGTMTLEHATFKAPNVRRLMLMPYDDEEEEWELPSLETLKTQFPRLEELELRNRSLKATDKAQKQATTKKLDDSLRVTHITMMMSSTCTTGYHDYDDYDEYDEHDEHIDYDGYGYFEGYYDSDHYYDDSD